MIRIKTTNCLNSEDEVILEFEEEFTGNLLHGLNISIEKCNGKGGEGCLTGNNQPPSEVLPHPMN